VVLADLEERHVELTSRQANFHYKILIRFHSHFSGRLLGSFREEDLKIEFLDFFVDSSKSYGRDFF
jgi:hypothetical protein